MRIQNDDEEYYDDEYVNIEAIPANTVNVYTDDDYIEVTTISDVYKTEEVEVNGELVEEYKLVKAGVKSKQTIWKSEISHIKQIFNENGNVKTKQVELGIKFREPITVIGNYKQLKECIFNTPSKEEYKTVGFKTWYKS
jgi:hypothetical protein